MAVLPIRGGSQSVGKLLPSAVVLNPWGTRRFMESFHAFLARFATLNPIAADVSRRWISRAEECAD